MSTQALEGLKRPGWLTFAAVIMFSVAGLRIVSAIYYFADSVRIANLTGGAFGGHFFLWGIWDLIIAAVAAGAGYMLLGGDKWGRIIAYLWAGIVIIQSFMIIGYDPWFAFGMIILAVLVIYACTSTSDYQTR